MIYGTDRTKPEDMPDLIADRELPCPVLLDPTKAYRAAANIQSYPTATLLDPEGRVHWQGQTLWRKTFADACEKEIEALLGR